MEAARSSCSYEGQVESTSPHQSECIWSAHCSRPVARSRCGSVLLLTAISAACAQRQKVIIDTDIGDDIDDAYALTLALHSPEFEILGVTTAWGDTALRAQLAARLLAAAGAKQDSRPAGVPTHSKSDFSQRAWATAGPASAHGNAVDFLLAQAKRYPHQITLIAIGPLTNLGAAIDRDPSAFRLFNRVVLMGGSIHCGYGNPRATPRRHRKPNTTSLWIQAPPASSSPPACLSS